MNNVISRQTYGHRFTQYMATYCVCLQPVAFIFMEFVAYVEYIYMWHICGIYMWHIHTPPSPLHCSPRALAPYFWPLVPPALCQPDSPCRPDQTCMIFVQTFTRPQFWEIVRSWQDLRKCYSYTKYVLWARLNFAQSTPFKFTILRTFIYATLNLLKRGSLCENIGCNSGQLRVRAMRARPDHSLS